MDSINFMNLRFFVLSIIVFFALWINPVEAFNNFQVKCGIDVLVETNFEAIKGKRVGLLANFSSRDRYGELTAKLMANSEVFQLKKIFTPEHGFYSMVAAGQKVGDSKVFGVDAISLYGSNRKPNKKQLSDIDVIVIDIQDIGIRSYTYISTAYNVLEAAAENRIPVIVCDRPNPIGGNIVDGNVLEKGRESFIGIVPITYLHGCTIGELAKMFVGEKWIKQSDKLELKVIKLQGWRREMSWEETQLMWYPTSPNIPTVNSIRGAAMVGIFGELSLFHIGIGSALPFQYFGLNTDVVANVNELLKADDLPGIVLADGMFTLNKSNMYGYFINFSDKSIIAPYTAGIKLALAFRDALPTLFDINKVNENNKSMFIKAVGSEELYNAIMKKATKEYVLKIATKGIEEFTKLRQKYLLYE